MVLSSQPSRTISAPRGDDEVVDVEDEEGVVGRIIVACCWDDDKDCNWGDTNVCGGGNLCCVWGPNFALIASVGEGFLGLLFPLRS